MCGRNGFFLIWAELAVCLVLLLATAVGFVCVHAVRYITQAEQEATALLLAEETMETMKYNARSDITLPIPAAVTRNGHSFQVATANGTETVSGIPVTFAQVVVTVADGHEYRFRMLTGPAAEPETDEEASE